MLRIRFSRLYHHKIRADALFKPTVASIQTHTMGKSLYEYLRMKIHPAVLEGPWTRIIVRGEYKRDPVAASISSTEKRDKPFNWQRPTASSAASSKVLQLHCFPGIEYVKHYAAITATYLSLMDRGSTDIARYALPTRCECLLPLLKSNLSMMGVVDIVVVGYVHGLQR